MTDPFVVLGVIASAHGIRGAVKVKSFTESAEALLTYDNLQDETGTAYKLTRKGEAKGQIICQIEGIKYRDEAEKLRGTKLGVPRSAMPAPNEDEFYLNDLIGMQALLEDGTAFGKVIALHNYGAGDILEIEQPNGKKELLLLTEQNVSHIDIDARCLSVAPPEIISGQEN